ncbi:MAG TPA: Clp protease N-terminal domain-containing protein [Acidimicrobiales bacterium]|jgi:ATP-dependent Clp protease ATP-binding subunit ClpA|nr:Clp protease N-terminal domain-containing protein [Acidimicrobiales bacterium]
MFERFTESSRAVLVEAQDLAQELGSSSINVLHILYGCAEGREDTAGKPLRDCGVTAATIRQQLPRVDEPPAGEIDPVALRAIGIDFEGVRATVEETFGPGALERAPDRRVPTKSMRRVPFTPEAKRSLEQALRVTLELHQRTIVPGHLLLGLLRLSDEQVSRAIEQSGTTVVAVSAAVLAGLSNG